MVGTLNKEDNEAFAKRINDSRILPEGVVAVAKLQDKDTYITFKIPDNNPEARNTIMNFLRYNNLIDGTETKPSFWTDANTVSDFTAGQNSLSKALGTYKEDPYMIAHITPLKDQFAEALGASLIEGATNDDDAFTLTFSTISKTNGKYIEMLRKKMETKESDATKAPLSISFSKDNKNIEFLTKALSDVAEARKKNGDDIAKSTDGKPMGDITEKQMKNLENAIKTNFKDARVTRIMVGDKCFLRLNDIGNAQGVLTIFNAPSSNGESLGAKLNTENADKVSGINLDIPLTNNTIDSVTKLMPAIKVQIANIDLLARDKNDTVMGNIKENTLANFENALMAAHPGEEITRGAFVNGTTDGGLIHIKIDKKDSWAGNSIKKVLGKTGWGDPVEKDDILTYRIPGDDALKAATDIFKKNPSPAVANKKAYKDLLPDVKEVGISSANTIGIFPTNPYEPNP